MTGNERSMQCAAYAARERATNLACADKSSQKVICDGKVKKGARCARLGTAQQVGAAHARPAVWATGIKKSDATGTAENGMGSVPKPKPGRI